MGKKASPAVIGAFVLGGAALLVVAVTIWGSGRLFQKGRSYVCYFPGSVNGLGVGAAVKFRGVQIGEVTDLRLRHAQVRGEPRIPVFVEIDDGRMQELGGAGAPYGAAYERIVADGLRARLQNQSIVTGVLYVELDLVPGSSLDLVQAPDATPPEIPTLPTPLEEATRSVGDILAQLKEVDWKGISKAVTKVVASVERLVDTPELKHAIARLPATLDSVRDLGRGAAGRRDAAGDARGRAGARRAGRPARRRAGALDRQPGPGRARAPRPGRVSRAQSERRGVRKAGGQTMSGRTRWVVLAALVGGCALGPRADPSRFFTLTAIDAGAQAGVDGRGPALGLGPVVLPGYLRRISMATRVGPNEVRYAEFDRWAEPLERSVPRILQQNLEPLLGRDRVVLYPWLQSAGVEVAVAVEILRFEPTADGQAELAAQWVVRDGSRSRVLLARESVLREPLAGRDAGAAAAALSRVLAALSSEIAHAVRELPRS